MNKKLSRILSLLLCLVMIIGVMSVPAFAEEAAGETEAATAKECDLKTVFNSNMYVKANAGAGLHGDVKVSMDLIGCMGTLYLPGNADPSQLAFSWDDDSITVAIGDTVYESGTAPVPAVGSSVTLKITKGYAFAYVTIKTLKGSEDVEAMFINLDESMGTIDAMNADPDHETSCYGNVNFGGDEYSYISIKGRGNSTWKSFDKKPYNITFYKKADFDKKKSVELIEGVSAKKWSFLANYLDNSLLRNKTALDLANELGIGLDCKFVDIWMNGEYLGNYLMTPKNDYRSTDGGYILENDNYIENVDPQFQIPGMYEFHDAVPDSGYYNRITVKDIGDDAVAAGVDASNIETYFNEAWSALIDYSTEDYQKYFDMDSWAKMFLMYEVSKTYDCFSGSLLMHRDGLTEDDKLIAGPVWDYDNSFGRTLQKFLIGITVPTQITAEGWYNDSIGLVASDKHYSLLQELEKHPSFMKRVSEIYNDYKYAFEGIVADVDSMSAMLEDSALMNNALWGTHHIGSYYYVTPVSLGTGKYAVNFEITTSWRSYVNNLKEFAAKRVMWMSDHMAAEAPVGEITQTVNKADNTVTLKAVLSAGNNSNTYQWQSSADGTAWNDIAGATSAKLVISAEEAVAGMQYRCAVTNEGVAMKMTHCKNVNASAKTILDAVEVNATTVVETKEVAIQNGTFTLMMNGKDMGEFTIAASGKGWTVCNEKGKYLAASGTEMKLSSSPFVWNFSDGVFSANVKIAKTSIGRWLGLGQTATAYLTVSGGDFAVSLDGGAAATFLQTTEVLALN